VECTRGGGRSFVRMRPPRFPPPADSFPPFTDSGATSGHSRRILTEYSSDNGRKLMKNRIHPGSQLVFGAVLILAGAALMLENWDILDIGPLWRYWPLLIIGFGGVKLFNAGSREEEGSALWTVIIGAWLLVSVLHLWGLGFRETWPAVFIAFGVSILWKSLPPKNTVAAPREVSDGQ
jgi:hypothetical protein